MLRRVPLIGSDLLQHIPRLEGVAQTILYQDKHHDGSGVPEDTVAGAQIPLHARLLKIVADLALAEQRGLARPAALEELRRNRAWYDPELLASALKCFGAGAGQRASLRRTIALVDLEVGQLLAADVLTSDGMLIVVTGQTVTEPLLRRLHNFAALSGVKEPIQIHAGA